MSQDVCPTLEHVCTLRLGLQGDCDLQHSRQWGMRWVKEGQRGEVSQQNLTEGAGRVGSQCPLGCPLCGKRGSISGGCSTPCGVLGIMFMEVVEEQKL